MFPKTVFMAIFLDIWPCFFNSAKLSCSSEVTILWVVHILSHIEKKNYFKGNSTINFTFFDGWKAESFSMFTKPLKRFAKVTSYIWDSTLMGPFFVQKTEKLILKKINSIKCLVSVRFFLHQKTHMYQVTN